MGRRPKTAAPRLDDEPAEVLDLRLAERLGVSLRRFRGWEPKQTHTVTAWDDQGRPVTWVTETEPEFDAEERESWYALRQWDGAHCPQCGNLRSVCSTPEGLHGEGFYPHRRFCFVTAVRMAAERRWQKQHEKAQPDEQGFLPTDGVIIEARVENTDPDDDFLEGDEDAMRELVARMTRETAPERPDAVQRHDEADEEP